MRFYTLKTGTPVEDEDSIFKFLWGVSHPEIQLPARSTYILTEDQINILKKLVHFKFLRVYVVYLT